MRVSQLALIAVLCGCGGGVSSNPDQSQLFQEADDRETVDTARLVDVSATIEQMIRSRIDVVRERYGRCPEKIARELPQFMDDVFAALGADVPGSGITLGWGSLDAGEVSTLAEIEVALGRELDSAKNEKYQFRFEHSKYRDNPVGIWQGRTWSHKTWEAAQHSLSPTIRIGQTLLGTDKIGHMMQQGYWYYRLALDETYRVMMGYFLEGHPDFDWRMQAEMLALVGRMCVKCARFGYYGSYSSGVVSLADCSANEFGFEFYSKLAADPLGYEFEVADLDWTALNEETNPGILVDGVVLSP